ncbi:MULTISPECIES: YciI family protein [Burkholderia cepacia complex]|uniref:YciI family protein n=1 Tax=Burkholderia cepacia complex TaxID=87882 RepID=UPI00157A6E25|nr:MULTISPECIES: YciI family protein [Burkholderia cepacia complex]NTY35867.1 YciI family protein [Burkholderia diffusa]
MLFIVYCVDHPGMAERRQTHFAAHKARLLASPLKARIAGPLIDPDGSVGGSLFLYEAADIDAVRRLVHEDPFNTERIWKTVDIRLFLNRADEH